MDLQRLDTVSMQDARRTSSQTSWPFEIVAVERKNSSVEYTRMDSSPVAVAIGPASEVCRNELLKMVSTLLDDISNQYGTLSS